MACMGPLVSVPVGRDSYLEKSAVCEQINRILVSVPVGRDSYLEESRKGGETCCIVSVPVGRDSYLESFA